MSDENSIDMAEVDDLTIANINNLESSPSKWHKQTRNSC